MTPEEAKHAIKLSWAEIQAEYPKAAMVVNYITKHYPDDSDRISSHKMLPLIIFSEYSNQEIEEMIDKLAIFNHWTKYLPEENNGRSI